MIKIDKTTSKIYIMSPYLDTGGPKSLHQLANVLVNEGYDVYIFYDYLEVVKKKQILYENCQAKICDTIFEQEDNKNNLLIVPETYTEVLKKYSKMQKMIWWLSLDYYLRNYPYFRAKFAVEWRNWPSCIIPLMYLKKKLIKDYIPPEGFIKVNELSTVYHLYNCEYVQKYLLNKGVKKHCLHYLCGPLEKNYLQINKESIQKEKKNQVAYNPKKIKKKFFEKIRKCVKSLDSTIQFIAIEGMSREEVYFSLAESKVYIDFGYFPGPERMPREAVALYCNIITSNFGSAKNDKDVAIPEEFKFRMSSSNIKKISRLIIEMCEHYDEYVDCFNLYRENVNNQILNFEGDIHEVFSNFIV